MIFNTSKVFGILKIKGNRKIRHIFLYAESISPHLSLYIYIHKYIHICMYICVCSYESMTREGDGNEDKHNV